MNINRILKFSVYRKQFNNTVLFWYSSFPIKLHQVPIISHVLLFLPVEIRLEYLILWWLQALYHE